MKKNNNHRDIYGDLDGMRLRGQTAFWVCHDSFHPDPFLLNIVNQAKVSSWPEKERMSTSKRIFQITPSILDD